MKQEGTSVRISTHMQTRTPLSALNETDKSQEGTSDQAQYLPHPSLNQIPVLTPSISPCSWDFTFKKRERNGAGFIHSEP